MELSINEQKAMEEKLTEHITKTGARNFRSPEEMFKQGYMAHMRVVEEKEDADLDKMLRDIAPEHPIKKLKKTMDEMFEAIDNMKRPSTQKWWGYIHTNGIIQVKRYFSRLDIEDANESPFCKVVYAPFDAVDRDDAIRQIKEKQ